MMLVLALRSDPPTVLGRARLQFSDDEIAEAFAATRGLTMPTQLRRMMRQQGRDLHAEFIHLLPNGFSYPTTSCLAFLKAGHNVAFVPIRARRRVGASKIRVFRDGLRFLLIIFKVVTLYSPLRIFFPIALVSFLTGLLYALWNVRLYGKIPMGAALLIQLAVVVFRLVSQPFAVLMSQLPNPVKHASVHRPAMQPGPALIPAGQIIPQPPQFWMSVCESVQIAPHITHGTSTTSTAAV
jgi:hypothetical protein